MTAIILTAAGLTFMTVIILSVIAVGRRAQAKRIKVLENAHRIMVKRTIARTIRGR